MPHLRKTLNMLHELILMCEKDPYLKAVTVDNDFDFCQHRIIFDQAMALLDVSDLARIVAMRTCSGHNVVGQMKEDWENEVSSHLGEKLIQAVPMGMEEKLHRPPATERPVITGALVRDGNPRSFGSVLSGWFKPRYSVG